MAPFSSKALALAIAALLISSCSPKKIGVVDPNTLPIRSNVPSQDDPSSCLGKPKCLVIYTTPWCRKTMQSRAFINALQSYLRTDKTYGLKLIIGNDEPQKIFECGKEYPGVHYYDPGDTAAEILAIDTIPALLVFDSQGNLLYRDGGLPRKDDKRTIEEFLADLEE